MTRITRHRLSCLMAAFLLLSLAPAAADARAGSGFSMGSRGSRTFSMPAPTRTSPYSAAPMDRSMTPRAAPFGGMSQGMRGHPLAAGLLGGFLGAGIGGMLFGHGFMGGGGMGLGGLLGLLLQVALIVFAVRWLLRRLSGAGARGLAGAAPAGLASGGYRQANARTMSGGNWAGNAPLLQIAAPDYRQFEQTLRDVQSAWTSPGCSAWPPPRWCATSPSSCRTSRAAAYATPCPTCAWSGATCRRPGARAAETTPRWRCATR